MDNKTLKRAIYPGTFDPITNGHIDIMCRALRVCDLLIVAVAQDSSKTTLFTAQERVKLISDVVNNRNIVVTIFSGLLVDFAAQNQCNLIIRGIRAISDYEYEFQMALMNRRLKPDIETVFMTPQEEYSYLSSRLVKEVCSLGGNLEGLVPEKVERELSLRLQRKK